MKNFSRKLIALLLVVMFCCSLMPVYASPSERTHPFELPVAFPYSDLFRGGSRSVSNESEGPTVCIHGTETYLREVLCGYNNTVKLRVDASGGSGSLKYQWYDVSMDNLDTSTWQITFKSSEAISGATKSTYTTPAITKMMSMDDPFKIYACRVTDSNGKKGWAAFLVTSIVELMEPDIVSYDNGVSLLLLGATLKSGYVYVDFGSDEQHLSGDPQWTLASKYQVYRKESGGKWASLKTVTGPGVDVPLDGESEEDYTIDFVDTTAIMSKQTAYKYRAYLNGKYTPFCPAESILFNPFEDVYNDSSYEYIAWAYDNDVIKGSTVTTPSGDKYRFFYPNDPCTRMNFVMILWKMHGKPSASGSNPFSDVSGSTSVKAVTWAVKKKLVTGTSATTFSPENNLSRINIIMILYKLAGSPKASAESQYEDISGSKTSKAVNWAVGKGIISPIDSTHFDPTGNCSRALLVEILCKYNKLYKIL